ncbi:MAG: hypothetical protein M3Z08_16375 [Chloroflexota bacterium]|nr:hypothetical protein [Chloroflexota bacterium]
MHNETSWQANAAIDNTPQLSLDVFFKSACEQKTHIQATHTTVKRAQNIFDNEATIAPAQCTHIVNSMEKMSEPLQKLSSLLETSVYTQQAVSPFRHSLLIQLRSTNKRLDKLVELITNFSFAYLKSSPQANTQKSKILHELILLEQDSEILLKCIDFLYDRVLLEEKRRIRRR